MIQNEASLVSFVIKSPSFCLPAEEQMCIQYVGTQEDACTDKRHLTRVTSLWYCELIKPASTGKPCVLFFGVECK